MTLSVPDEGYTNHLTLSVPDEVITWWRLYQSFDFECTWWRLYQSFDFECTWWRLYQKRGVCTKLDVYMNIHVCFFSVSIVIKYFVYKDMLWTVVPLGLCLTYSSCGLLSLWVFVLPTIKNVIYFKFNNGPQMFRVFISLFINYSLF